MNINTFKAIKNMCVIIALVIITNGCSSDIDVYQPVPAPEFANQLQVKMLWSRSVGSGVGKYYSQLSPVYDDERVYAASRNGDVYAFMKNDGHRVWHTDLDDENENDNRRSTRLSGGLTVDDNKLFVTSENGYVYTLDATNGELLWKSDLGLETISAPAVLGSQLFVLSVSGQLFCLNIEDGAQQWATGNDNGLLSLRGNTNPVTIPGAVLYGTVDGKINIVSASQGLLLTQLQVGIPHGKTKLARLNDVNTSPLIISNEIYTLAFNGDLKGFILPSANTIWVRKYASYQNMAYDLSDIAITDKNSHVYGIIRIDGSERWVNTALTYRNVTAPAYYGDYVIVGDYEGYLYWLDSATGEFREKFEVDSSGLYTAPLVDDDVIYVQSRGGDLYALKLKNEEE